MGVVVQVDAEKAEDGVTDPVQHPDDREEHPREDDQGRGENRQHPVGKLDRPVLGSLLADHHVQSSADRQAKPDRQSAVLSGQRLGSQPHADQQRVNDPGDQRFDHRTECQAGDRDPDLARGQVEIELRLISRHIRYTRLFSASCSNREARALTAANSAATK